MYCGGFDRDDLLTYDDYRTFIDLNTPSGEPIPIPDPKPRYSPVKPKVKSSVIKEVLCRKKRHATSAGSDQVSKQNSGSLGEMYQGNTNLSMDLSEDELLGLVSQDERLMIDFIVNCLQLKQQDRMTCEAALQHPFILL